MTSKPRMQRVLAFITLSSSAAIAIPSMPAQTTTKWATICNDSPGPTKLERHHRRTASLASAPALTTTFTPSPGCLDQIYKVIITAGTFYASLGTPNATNCFPPGWHPDPAAPFSPGICPSGYTIDGTSLGHIGSLYETTATCCPR